jgi:hypothetical protein
MLTTMVSAADAIETMPTINPAATSADAPNNFFIMLSHFVDFTIQYSRVLDAFFRRVLPAS